MALLFPTIHKITLRFIPTPGIQPGTLSIKPLSRDPQSMPASPTNTFKFSACKLTQISLHSNHCDYIINLFLLLSI